MDAIYVCLIVACGIVTAVLVYALERLQERP